MKNKILDIDAEFADVVFDETSIKRSTGIKQAWDNKSPQQRQQIGNNISAGKKINHPFKGKTLPKEWIDNVSQSLKGQTKIQRTLEHSKKFMRGVITPDCIFESVKACQDYYNISECTVRNRIIRGRPGWEYQDGLSDKEQELRKQWLERKSNHFKLRPIQTPWGQYATRKDAVKAGLLQGIVNAAGKLDRGLKTKPNDFYYVKK